MASKLFREQSINELNEIVSKLLSDTVLGCKLLTGGMFNTTYVIDTENHGKVVMRLGPVNRHLLLPYEHYLMETEADAIRRCSDIGIKTSEMLALDLSKTIVDRDVMIVKHLPALSMSEVTLTDEEARRIKAEVGYDMRLYNSIKGESFGRPHDVNRGNGCKLWSDAIRKELTEFELVCKPCKLYSEEEHTRIRRLFENAKELFDEIKTPYLLHNDLWTGNILVTKEGHEYAAIIDGDRAIWGDPDMELACMEYWTSDSDEFWNAYGSRPKTDIHSRIRKRLYDLLMTIWAVYIYEIEYDNHEASVGNYQCSLSIMDEIEALYRESSGIN